MRKIGIIGAMQLEIDAYADVTAEAREVVFFGIRFLCGKIEGVDTVLCVSGVGKVNAAFVTAVLSMKFGVTEIINTGVAGGIGLAPLTLVIAGKCCQHDVDTSALGDPIGWISGGGFDCVFIETDRTMCGAMLRAAEIDAAETAERENRTKRNVVVGTVATGDQFIASKEKTFQIHQRFGAVAVDCESAAILQVAVRAGIPAAIVRSVSDGADNGGAKNFLEFAASAAERAKSTVIGYFKITEGEKK